MGMPTSHSTSVRTEQNDDELELPVEEVAERLGLPAAMLIRRIEAGDIPARRVDDASGSHYHVRITDLGTSTPAVTPEGEAAVSSQEITGVAEVHRNGRIEPHPAPQSDDETEATDVTDPVDATTLEPEDIAAAIPPPPVRGTVELSPVGAEGEGPRAELAMMSLDPRELVAGLLDRWERTLEQRIYAEQRQRFEAELTNRQAKVKQLQLELEAVRAEHAAALAEKERELAQRGHELQDRERDLADMLHSPPRRGWLFRR
jgi:hypothetical protein